MMIQAFARIPAVLVAALCAVWVLALITMPILYAHLRGWGYYWAFSIGEFVGNLPFLLGPPVLFMLVWRWAPKAEER
jgi:hypothetical protein